MATLPTPNTVELLALDREAPAQYDDLGNLVLVFKDPVRHAVYGWAPPRPGSEAVSDGVTTEVIELVVYAPNEPWVAAITAQDRVRVLGTSYEIVGTPDDWNHGPFGFQPGYTIPLKRGL